MADFSVLNLLLTCIQGTLTIWEKFQGGLAWFNALRPVASSLVLHSPTKKHADAAHKEASVHHPEAPRHADWAATPPAGGYQAAPVERLRHAEFARLKNRVYADYAGAPPFSEALLLASTQELLTGIHGNPHSEHGWGDGKSAAAVAQLRQATLAMCHADPEHYVCVLTGGATAALKLVADAFPWSAQSSFLYLHDNHTSVLGMREVAARHGASTHAIPAAALQLSATSADAEMEDSEVPAAGTAPEHLFAFPLESNLTGVRYNQALVQAVQQRQLLLSAPLAAPQQSEASNSSPDGLNQDAISTSTPAAATDAKARDGAGRSAATGVLPAGRWRVLIDAAKACGSRPPDLSTHPADFVALAYYKIFGHPSGLGALLVRRDALPSLRKAYFGGGTVSAAMAAERFHRLRPAEAGLEDGTLPFLAIPAAVKGFAFLRRLGGWPSVDAHAQAVAKHLVHALSSMRHANGAPVCVLYGRHGVATTPAASSTAGSEAGEAGAVLQEAGVVSGQGAVVAFNLRQPGGGWVGHRQVERLAALERLHLRTGCCCNPGACAEVLELSAADFKANYEAGHQCWDDQDVLNGKPTGVVRASFGYASSLADADAIAAFVKQYFVQPGAEGVEDAGSAVASAPQAGAEGQMQPVQGSAVVQSLFVYPIKSCPGFQVKSWPLGLHGLLFDRQWAIVEGGGRPLSLTRCPALAALKPELDLQAGVLRVTAAGVAHPLEVPLPEGQYKQYTRQSVQQSNAKLGADIGAPAVVTPAAKGVAVSMGSESGANGTALEDTGGAAVAADMGAPAPVAVLPSCSRTAEADLPAAPAASLAAASEWFSAVLQLPCRFVQHSLAGPVSTKAEAPQQQAADVGSSAAAAAAGGPRGFANQAQLLVVSTASVSLLQSQTSVQGDAAAFAARFRPNVIVTAAPPTSSTTSSPVDGTPPSLTGYDSTCRSLVEGSESGAVNSAAPELAAYSEEGWTAAEMGGCHFVSAGACPRCIMVCVDPSTGRRDGPEPLLTLAKQRRQERGTLGFGVLLNREPSDHVTQEGDLPRLEVGMAVNYVCGGGE